MWIVKFLPLILFQIVLIKGNCLLNLKDDLSGNHPLLLSASSPKWISLSGSTKGHVNIERDEIIKIACPQSSTNTNTFKSTDLKSSNIISAKCKDGKNFIVNNKVYHINDLHCDSPVEVTEKSTGEECLGRNTELIKVGYQVGNDFVTEYKVCFDKQEKSTLFTEMTISENIDKATITTRESTWLPKKFDLFRNIDMESAYKCNKQADTFKQILNKNFFDNNRCCLEKGKLVPKEDMVFSAEQASTAHYLNTAPQWSTCNRNNWVEVEKRIKNLAISTKKPLTVWTGTYRKMSLAAKWGFSHKDMYLHYNGNSDKAIPVPLFIWKVVFDQQSQKAVAIIQINNPHLSISEIDSFVLCEDICKNVNWLNFLERKTVVDGYVYCCDLPNFEFGFAFKKSPFQKARGGILRDDTRSG